VAGELHGISQLAVPIGKQALERAYPGAHSVMPRQFRTQVSGLRMNMCRAIVLEVEANVRLETTHTTSVHIEPTQLIRKPVALHEFEDFVALFADIHEKV
jgi:hypothetical protein